MDAKPDGAKDANTRERMQLIANLVDEALPAGWSFFVLAAPFNREAGRINYVSNAQRDTILELMKEFIAKNTPENHAKHT